MSLSIEPAADPRPIPIHPYTRPIALTTLLTAEALALSLRFDGPRDLDPTSWLSVVSNTGYAARMIFIAVVGTAMFGGFRLAIRFLRAFDDDACSDRRWQPWLLGHGVGLAVFALVSIQVCDVGTATTGHQQAWILAWVSLGLATVLCGLGAMLAPGAWLAILRRARLPIVLGGAAGVAVASGGYLTSLSWKPLARSTFLVVQGLLGLVSSDVHCDPSAMMVGESGFSVRIAPECSGFEGIGMIWTFLALYLWWSRRSLRWPAALILIPIGTAAIWLGNAARIAALVLIGARWSPSVALGGFHSQAGWLAFLAVGLGVVAVSRQSRFFSVDVRETSVPMASNPTAGYLSPMLAIVATSMVTGAFSPGFDAAYGLRVLTGGWAIWHFRDVINQRLWSWSWSAVAIGLVAFVLWSALEPASGESARTLGSGISALPAGWGWAWVATRVIGSVLIVPMAEELAFRGYLSRRLISSDFESVPGSTFSWASVLFSSAAFGMLHGRWIAGMLVGLLFAFAYHRRGRISDAILAHAVTNLLVAATVLVTGDWTMWS